jgi:hypothetical protein
LPADLAADWTESSVTTDRVLEVRSVTVTVATRVYDDESLREAVASAGGPDATLRFLFVSECVVPETAHSRALGRLVTNRAKSGFVDRLTDRGFEDVRETGRRSLRADDAEGSAFGYEGRCALPGVTVGVEGWLAVWPVGSGRFLLAGGAYPTSVLAASDDAAATAVRDAVDPGRFREELFAAVRSIP